MKGLIIMIPFPLTNLTSSIVRPALVLHERIDDIIVCFITSRPTPVPAQFIVKVPKTHSEFRLTKLRKASTLILDKVFTIEKRLIKAELGKVGIELKEEINLKLQNIFSL